MQTGSRIRELITGLDHISLELTRGCNLECIGCYTSSSPRLEKSPDRVDWSDVMKQAYDAGAKSVQFIGGEPTYNDGLAGYISEARKIGFESIEVYTNLTTMSQDTISNFKENGVRVATSFYSFNHKIHDKITGSAGSFFKTVDGIEAVVGAGLELRVGMILYDRLNGGPYHVAMTKAYLQGLGVDMSHVGVDKMRSVGRGSLVAPIENLDDALCGSCWKGKITVSPEGEMYPCQFARHVSVGNVNKVGLKDAVVSRKLKEFRLAVLEKSTGMKCEAWDSMRSECSPESNCSPDDGCEPDCSPEAQRREDMMNKRAEERKKFAKETDLCGPYYSDNCVPDACSPVNECSPDNKCTPEYRDDYSPGSSSDDDTKSSDDNDSSDSSSNGAWNGF